MSVDTKTDELGEQDPGTTDRRYQTSEVAMILGRRWHVPAERESLNKLSDALGLETRSTPNGKRSWSLAQIDQLGRVLRARHLGNYLVRHAIELRADEHLIRLVDEAYDEIEDLGLATSAA